MTLKLYYDLLSQPSRALYIILNKTKVPFEKCRVDLKKGEHLTEEYREIARNQKAPAIDDDGFKLSESVAIIRYLAREKSIPDHWYPKDSKKQAKVDEYLEWQHNNIRAHCALFFQVKWLIPCLTGEEPNEKKVMNFQRRMSDTLDFMESVWLSPGPWIAGDEISVADLWAACEIEQPRKNSR